MSSVLSVLRRGTTRTEIAAGTGLPDDLVELIIAEGQLTVCTQCAVRRGIEQEHLLPGVRIAGAPKFVEEIMAPGTQALVY